MELNVLLVNDVDHPLYLLGCDGLPDGVEFLVNDVDQPLNLLGCDGLPGWS